jgi:hypothetical protein
MSMTTRQLEQSKPTSHRLSKADATTAQSTCSRADYPFYILV